MHESDEVGPSFCSSSWLDADELYQGTPQKWAVDTWIKVMVEGCKCVQ